MARRGTNNPRQVPSKNCGCGDCRARHPEPERRPTRACSGPWQARYRDADGVQRAKNFPRKNEALGFLDEVRASVRQGTYLDPSRGGITLEDWWEKWWPANGAGRTTTVARKVGLWTAHIRPRWGKRPLLKITHLDVQQWIREEVKGHATQTKVLALMRAMLRDAVRDRRLTVNPVAEVVVTASRPVRTREELAPPTADQWVAVQEHIPDWYAPLTEFVHETGLRWSEASGLRWSYVNLAASVVTVREILIDNKGEPVRQGAPKTTAGIRTIAITERAVVALRVMEERWLTTEARRRAATATTPIASGMQPQELVFRGPKGGPLRGHNFRRRIWVPALQAAGVARRVVDQETGREVWWPRIHDYRHSVASRLHAAGISERDVQDYLGQRRGGRVTWLYTHGSEGAQQSVRDALEAPAPGRLRAVS
ncbi:tyrosine-type recombinase/integrase [Streptomyces bohaiensis]|uniref:Tyrosine-type recombinase/integrase n=1 Tax=Streptomyces bohaiensis TaxID=1431344 RepID=A0ABX1C7H0_9ACTN|nr:tyrosine-type recombinase/integrase [Streptomyces bohaiensis]NJQ14186.1 tyrosine-type recombinase/integrase [Streptomyces bohaiensis]